MNDLPIWHKTAVPELKLPSLDGALDTEIAVVGAGIAGLSTALRLAENGVHVVVVEAAHPGSVNTQASSGLLVPDYVSHTPHSVGQRIGAKAGHRMSALVGGSAARAFELISTHELSCGALQAGFVVPAHTPAVARALEARAMEWQSLGMDVQLLCRDETRRFTGTDFYGSAIRFAQGGVVNPLALCRELARRIVELGGAVFTQSPVLRVAEAGEGWLMETASGSVRSRRIVFAANAANAALHPALRATTLPFDICEFATEPLSEHLREAILPDGGCFTDRQPNLFTARFDVDGRIISAFPDFLGDRKHDFLVGVAKDRLQHFYPALKGVAIESLWRGTARISASLLPHLYEVGESAIAIQACNGRGLAINMALGTEVGEYFSSDCNAEKLSIPLTRPKPISAYFLARRAPALAMVLARLRNK